MEANTNEQTKTKCIFDHNSKRLEKLELDYGYLITQVQYLLGVVDAIKETIVTKNKKSK